jgi:hypothetical protein
MVRKEIRIEIDDGSGYDLTITDTDTAQQILHQLCKIKCILSPGNELIEDELLLVGEIRQENGENQQKLYMPGAIVLSEDIPLVKLSVIGSLKQINHSQDRLKKLKIFHEMMERFSNEIDGLTSGRLSDLVCYHSDASSASPPQICPSDCDPLHSGCSLGVV